jgi:hypothetical protein
MSQTSAQDPDPIALQITTSRRPEASAEATIGSEERRPEMSAESMSPRMRLGLALLVLVASCASGLIAVAATAWPDGILHLGTIAVAGFAALVGLIWMLLLVFGALIENNRALGQRAHGGWLAVIALTGPLGMLAYWAMHVRPARYVPRAS